MTCPVTHRAVPERHPAAPRCRQVCWMIRAILGRSQPYVPVERRRNLMVFAQFRKLIDSRIDRVAAAMNRLHIANGSVPNPFAQISDGIERMALVTKLSDHLMLFCCLH